MWLVYAGDLMWRVVATAAAWFYRGYVTRRCGFMSEWMNEWTKR